VPPVYSDLENYLLSWAIGASPSDINTAKNDYNSKKNQEPYWYLSEQEFVAIVIYTGNSVYSKLNASIRNYTPANPDDFKTWAPLAKAIESGLEKLPSFPDKTYRGIRKPANFDDIYKPNAYVVWMGFSSSSFSNSVAYAYGDAVFNIAAAGADGKNIQEVSLYKGENEVLFGMLTEVYVNTVGPDDVFPSKTKVDVNEVEIATSDPTITFSPQDKVVLWVDDHKSNNTAIINEATALGIKLKLAASTQEAYEWLTSTVNVLNRNTTNFRIISDAVRTELGVNRPTAYREFLQIVRARFQYKEDVMVYTYLQHANDISDSERKFLNINVQYNSEPARKWVTFL